MFSTEPLFTHRILSLQFVALVCVLLFAFLSLFSSKWRREGLPKRRKEGEDEERETKRREERN